MPDLIPVFSSTINSKTVQTVNARDIHEFLGVKSDFTDWIKRRIATYDFHTGIDYTLLKSEEVVNQQHTTVTGDPIEYHVSLDMAKQLAMVERTAKGKEARLYFIACERRALAALQPAVPALPPPDVRRQLEDIRLTEELLADLGTLAERDKLMFSDYARNALAAAHGAPLLTAGASAAHGFSVAERVTQLGYHLTRAQASAFLPAVGRKVAGEWRNRYEGEPATESRSVDGATRKVAWYDAGEASWIDPIIQSVLHDLMRPSSKGRE